MPCCVAFEVILINIVVVHELLKSMIYLYFRGLRRGHGERERKKKYKFRGASKGVQSGAIKHGSILPLSPRGFLFDA
jgi:hypothetical protein